MRNLRSGLSAGTCYPKLRSSFNSPRAATQAIGDLINGRKKQQMGKSFLMFEWTKPYFSRTFYEPAHDHLHTF